MSINLTGDEALGLAFRKAVDTRDGGKCMVCSRRTTEAFPPDHPLSRHRHHRVGGDFALEDVITFCGACYLHYVGASA